MNKQLFISVVFISSLSVSITAVADGDPARGKSLYASCIACHGQNGEGLQALNSPRLSGLKTPYLVRQLQNFRMGFRGGTSQDVYGAQMVPMAKALPDEQALEDVAAYIATLQSSNPPRTETTGDPEKGMEEYLQCTSCHGFRGQGYKGYKGETPRYDSPRLAGQYDWYIIRQLKNFRDGTRGVTEDKPGNYMRARAITLTDDQTIRNIAAYISTLE